MAGFIAGACAREEPCDLVGLLADYIVPKKCPEEPQTKCGSHQDSLTEPLRSSGPNSSPKNGRDLETEQTTRSDGRAIFAMGF